MIILDTDHLSILQQPESPLFERLQDTIKGTTDTFHTTVISLEEQTRGWLAAIGRQRQVHDQTLYYVRLASLVRFYAKWKILPFDEPAADRFQSLRSCKVRIGTVDLKIASIVLTHGALLLSLYSFQLTWATSNRYQGYASKIGCTKISNPCRHDSTVPLRLLAAAGNLKT
jgi:tRNA(fMet)-specific endonuclease VapC